MARCATLRRLADRAVRELQAADRAGQKERSELTATRRALRKTLEAQEILQKVAQSVQQQAHDRIASVVTKAVQAVYGTGVTFRLEFFKRRGKTEAEPVFYEGDMRVDPVEMGGGGMIDVAALALRVVRVVMKHPAGRRVLWLDEPFRNIHGEGNRERAKELVLKMSEEFKFQIILVTGLDWLECGDIIRLDKVKK